MAAESGADIHHGAPRCLLGLFDAAGGFADWSESDAEAERLSIEVCGLSREELRVLIESSTLEIPTTEHRRVHQEEGDFVWWGRRGGRRTLALYGRPYFSLLARLRWDRVQLETLTRPELRQHKMSTLPSSWSKRGTNTSEPKSAPKTAPNRTSAMPLARR
jgi:hypothetical protein